MAYRKYKDYHRINKEGIEEKQCKVCFEWFVMDKNNFGIDNKNKDGFNVLCKSCQSNKGKEIYNDRKINNYNTDQNKKKRKTKGFNDYEIFRNITNIIIVRESGEVFKAKIDTEDLQLLIDLNYRWHIDVNRRKDNIHVVCHESIGVVNGIPKYIIKGLHQLLVKYNPEIGEKVDHKDGDGLNNCKSNLRIISNKGNLTNRKGKNRNNKSGFRNVYWNTKDERWVVALQIEGKRKEFGRFKFEDLEKAGARAEEVRQKYYNKVIKEETLIEVI